MNSDTVGTQWGQDEKVLLIEPDRGEQTERWGGMMEGGRGKTRSLPPCWLVCLFDGGMKDGDKKGQLLTWDSICSGRKKKNKKTVCLLFCLQAHTSKMVVLVWGVGEVDTGRECRGGTLAGL